MCQKLFCSELHDAACEAVSTLPTSVPAPKPRARRDEPRRDDEAERVQAEQLVLKITQHRRCGRSALLIGDLDTAFHELSIARDLEPDLDHVGAIAREVVPRDWELETDLTPLARALSARAHPSAAETWRRVLDDRPARSIQAEAADWLARHAFTSGHSRSGLRMLHAASLLGHRVEPDAFLNAYKVAGLQAAAQFSLYLAATRMDVHSARANRLLDPLTDRPWADQDPRWWLEPNALAPRHAAREQADHQPEALARARDLAHGKRDQGWLLLAEGDYLAGPLGARTIGRNVRAGCAEQADHDTFVRIRLAYEGAADRLPDVAWPWYRLAELLAWAGFSERAQELVAEAERRTLGSRHAERVQRPVLRALVECGLGSAQAGMATARPFPAEPFSVPLTWRLRLR